MLMDLYWRVLNNIDNLLCTYESTFRALLCILLAKHFLKLFGSIRYPVNLISAKRPHEVLTNSIIILLLGKSVITERHTPGKRQI